MQSVLIIYCFICKVSSLCNANVSDFAGARGRTEDGTSDFFGSRQFGAHSDSGAFAWVHGFLRDGGVAGVRRRSASGSARTWSDTEGGGALAISVEDQANIDTEGEEEEADASLHPGGEEEPDMSATTAGDLD
jgi:hypothetical protein